MAYESSSAPSSGIWSAIRGALGIFDDLNKANYVGEEATPFPLGEYESNLDEKEIAQLAQSWKERYAPYYAGIEAGQKTSFEYWLGKQQTEDIDQWQGTMAPVDNLIFEAVETFLPLATRQNPDPIVASDPTPPGQALAKDVRNALMYEADRQKLRLVLKRTMRHWLIYKIGVVKLVWNPEKNEIETCVVNPKRMIFDIDGFVDFDSSFKGEYLGEKIREPAHRVLQKFGKFLTPEKREYILQKANQKKGTMLEYIEWWYRDTDVFYTMDQIVLGKFKNHMWNYDGEEIRIDPSTGEPATLPVQGKNFLKKPSSPYRFLSIFSTGIQPHDETGLIIQNIGIQDLINRRWRQIDKNISRINNGLVVNGRSFSDEQASMAATALRRGTAIRVPNPSGNNLQADVMNFPAPGLAESVMENLQDARNELKNLFGTSGSSPSGQASKETARGQILSTQLDASRIGGGIAEYLEQFADSIYNYWVQMMYVYYDEPHYMAVAGISGGKEMLALSSPQFGLVQTLNVTVKDGSLIPKDPLTQRNEAIQLWGAQAIDPRALYQKLEFPDPNEAAKQLILWELAKGGNMQAMQMYMPELMQPDQNGMSPMAPAPQGQPIMQGDQNMNPPGRPPEPQNQQTPNPVASQSKQIMESVQMPKL